MTTIKINSQEPMHHSLSYHDGQNIIKVNERYYLIAQCDYGMMILFELKEDMEWNRSLDPVKVQWSELNTETIKTLIPEFQGKDVKRVNAKITIEIF